MGIISHENAVIDNSIGASSTDNIVCLTTELTASFKKFVKEVYDNHLGHPPTKKIYDIVLSRVVECNGAEITTLPDEENSLSGSYFLISNHTTKYYVWFNTGSSNDPAVPNRTGIQVSIATNDPADIVAIELATALDDILSFNSPTPTSNKVTLNNSTSGNYVFIKDQSTSFKIKNINPIFSADSANLLSNELIAEIIGLIPVGYLSEACTISTIWFLRNEFITFKNNTLLNEPELYAEIKDFLLYDDKKGYGFIEGEGGINDTELMKILNPDLLMGTRINVNNIDKISPNKNCTIAELLNIIQENNNNNKYNNKRKYNLKFNPTGYTNKKYFMLLTKHLAVLLNGISEIKEKYISKYSNCMFNVFLPNKEPEINLMMAAGDGTNTKGLFGEGNKGVFFFNYNVEFYENEAKTEEGYLCVNYFPKRDFKTFGKKRTTTLHLSMFGLDFDGIPSFPPGTTHNVPPPTKKDVHCMRDYDNLHFHPDFSRVFIRFKISDNEYEIVLAASNITNNGHDWNILTPISSYTVFVKPPSNDLNLYTFETRDKYEIIGTYDIKNQDFIFKDIENIIPFTLRVSSAYIYSGEPLIEELNLVANLVEGKKPELFSLNLSKAYLADYFEMTTAKKLTIPDLPIDTRANFIVAIHNIISKIISDDVDFKSKLKGGFIGKLVSPEPSDPYKCKVAENTAFHFTPTPPTRVNTSEILPPSIDIYKSIRISFGYIEIGHSTIEFHVESYTDPVRSRLDQKFNTDYRSAPNKPNITSLDDFTAAANQVYTPLRDDKMPGSTAPVPSYNPVLSGLRCFGLLECLVYNIWIEINNDTLISSTNKAKVLNKVKEMFKSSTVDIYMGDGKIRKPLNYDAYQSFKFYSSLDDENLYNDLTFNTWLDQ